MRFWFNDEFAPMMYPTSEDLLEINFHAIVSDCRGLIRGTLVPRSWADLSDTWSKEPDEIKVRHRANSIETAEKMQRSRMKCLARTNRRNRIKQMARVLEANGMPLELALVKAKELLTK